LDLEGYARDLKVGGEVRASLDFEKETGDYRNDLGSLRNFLRFAGVVVVVFYVVLAAGGWFGDV